LILALSAGVADGVVAGQSAVERYRAAQKIFEAYSEDGFKHDDSRAALDAMNEMSAASQDVVLELMARDPQAGAKEIEGVLCRLDADVDCEHQNYRSGVAELGPRLFLAQDRTGETGIVFLAGMRDGRPGALWRIDKSKRQAADRDQVLESWRPENSGSACMEREKKGDFSRCGPLYATVGALPPDAHGRPRFYVDAGYAQEMGATVGMQTSVWRWDGHAATLLWIDNHALMVDQKVGTSFAGSVLSIGEKDFFRSFFSCGSCVGRQMVHRLRITPEGVEDLGKASLTPELDLVDELFWRISKGKPTADIASPDVARFFKQPIKDAQRKSKKIDPDYFSTGMIDDVAVTKTGNVERLCFTPDDIGQLYFTIALGPNGKMRLTRVEEAGGKFGSCATAEK
jgi:hypothetical protein